MSIFLLADENNGTRTFKQIDVSRRTEMGGIDSLNNALSACNEVNVFFGGKILIHFVNGGTRFVTTSMGKRALKDALTEIYGEPCKIG